MDTIFSQAASLGIAGLLFVMWWIERQERTRAGHTVREALTDARTLSQINDHLLDVVRANTDALAALREELRSHRISETEWLTRLSRQLEQLTQ